MFAGEKPPAIAEAQACLVRQGCYDGNKAEVDGIVGPFTRAALYRLAYGECTPAASVPPCGSGDDTISWRLTKVDIDDLEKAHAPVSDDEGQTGAAEDTSGAAAAKPATSIFPPGASVPVPASGPATGPVSDQAASAKSAPPASPAQPDSVVQQSPPAAGSGTLTPAQSPLAMPLPKAAPPSTPSAADALWQGELKKGFDFIQDLEYPTPEMFTNALEFFTDQYVAGEAKAHQTVLKEVKKDEPEIVKKACKNYPGSQKVPEWKPNWKANMAYPLSDRVYALYPSAMLTPLLPGAPSTAVPPAYKLDLGVLSGIGWAGATFSQSMGITLRPAFRDVAGGIDNQIKIARQFRTDVDLVVYKSQSAEEWFELTSEDSNLRSLASQISAEVTQQRHGFLNDIQYWTLPDALTMAATAWDGVTLDFRGFPFNDPEAVTSLVNLLKYMRSDLTEAAAKGRKSIWRGKPQTFDVNLVVPYATFMADGAPMLSVLKDECDLSRIVSLSSQNRIMQLAALVPKDRAAGRVEQNANQADEIVDNFIVLLPQPTGCAKKALRLGIEAGFERTPGNLERLKADPNISLASWRYQMLRRVIFELSPETWKYAGPDYQRPGSQFYDDLVYAKDNFGGVAFSSMPAFEIPAAGGSEASTGTSLALDIHHVFAVPGTPDFGGRTPSGTAIGKQWQATVYLANICGAYRRQIALTAELLLFLLLLYAVLSYWIFDLRTFYEEHHLYFWGALLLAGVLIVLLCLYDRRLREVAAYIYVGLSFLVLIAAWALQYIRSSMQRDLP
jgi:hypothetical protein